MSNNDSIDEETKRILAEVDSNEPMEIKDERKKTKEKTNDDYNEYDISDDTEADDKEW